MKRRSSERGGPRTAAAGDDSKSAASEQGSNTDGRRWSLGPRSLDLLRSEESGREPWRLSFTETGTQQPGDPLPASDNVVALSSRPAFLCIDPERGWIEMVKDEVWYQGDDPSEAQPAIEAFARLEYRLKWSERVCVLAFMAACLGAALVLWLYA